jgi:capsular polysaccharide biosynthesis protein
MFLWGVVFALLAGIVSVLIPGYYKAESDVIIISRNQVGLDPFTESKIAEQIGGNLAQVVGTEDFYTKVMQAPGTTFDKTRWTNLTSRDLRKFWARDVTAQVVYGTNLLKIMVYSTSKDDTQKLANAVTDTLVGRGLEYVGGGVNLKVVNTPLVSRFQARPNIFVTTAGGFVAGVVLAGLWLVRYKRHLLGLA